MSEVFVPSFMQIPSKDMKIMIWGNHMVPKIAVLRKLRLKFINCSDNIISDIGLVYFQSMSPLCVYLFSPPLF